MNCAGSGDASGPEFHATQIGQRALHAVTRNKGVSCCCGRRNPFKHGISLISKHVRHTGAFPNCVWHGDKVSGLFADGAQDFRPVRAGSIQRFRHAVIQGNPRPVDRFRRFHRGLECASRVPPHRRSPNWRQRRNRERARDLTRQAVIFCGDQLIPDQIHLRVLAPTILLAGEIGAIHTFGLLC
jgi:hypothetical protein